MLALTMEIFGLYNKHVKGSRKGAVVPIEIILICNLTKTTQKVLSTKAYRVYLSTKVLKHLYDEKPAEEFDKIMKNLVSIVKFPDEIYENKGGKTAQVCFLKEIDGEKYFCPLEITNKAPKDTEGVFEIVTTFRISKSNYLKNYKLIWSWRDDTPSS